MTTKENVIQTKSFQFAIKAINLSKRLRQEGEFIVSKQLARSGTSIGANVEEVLAGQSRKDFVSKMAIASKESRETRYWLRLLQVSQTVQGDYSEYLKDIEEIIRILTAIVKSTIKKS
jgi:four helix bundle protein